MIHQGRFEFEGEAFQMVDPAAFPFWEDLPYSLRILLENGIRSAPASGQQLIAKFEAWFDGGEAVVDYYPGRVLMQDLTGVPALVDLAAMRDACAELGGDPNQINPLCRVDLVADHSVTVNHYGSPDAYAQNVADEVRDNQQRYAFLKWAQQAFEGVRIVPPGKGICHQVNLEYLATVAETQKGWVYPDTLVGLDSHTTMINGLAVLGWGVGGIEAEAAMLGQPIRMVLPQVVGVELKGLLREGVNATDLVLAMTKFLRGMNVVGQFVEFYGEGLSGMDLAMRATVANMSPEFGATCAFFPADEKTIDYLQLTGRDAKQIRLVEQYLKAAGLYHDVDKKSTYSKNVVFDLSSVVPCIAGPHRPEQMVPITQLKSTIDVPDFNPASLSNGSVVIAAITSCTNTSNPSVLIGAGLLAKKALEKGLEIPDWVKPSIAPGSRVVMRYLESLGLDEALASIGFHLVGYGCTTCIGNSGPLDTLIAKQIEEQDLKVCAVLSGNRNFEGRVHPQTQLNYLASPALVVAYAIAGTMCVDLSKDPVGVGKTGEAVYLKDIWPSNQEIEDSMRAVQKEMFLSEYADILNGTKGWDQIKTAGGASYLWDEASSYIQPPPFLKGVGPKPEKPKDVVDAHILALLGDNVTTDHISPAGHIPHESAAGQYLDALGIQQSDFNSYGSRRGNAAVMVRGTLANTRLRNMMAGEKVGGYTAHVPSNELMSIYDAAMRYQQSKTPLIIVAGRSYGVGSSRDWAAKGVMMLGVKVVLAHSFERIHRTNLIGMGVLPCRFVDDIPELTGREVLNLIGIEAMTQPGALLTLQVSGGQSYQVQACLDTDSELAYFLHGGILPYVLRQLVTHS